MKHGMLALRAPSQSPVTFSPQSGASSTNGAEGGPASSSLRKCSRGQLPARALAWSPPAPELGLWAAPVKSRGKETLPIPRLAGATVGSTPVCSWREHFAQGSWATVHIYQGRTRHGVLGSGSQHGLRVTRRSDGHHRQTLGGTERDKLSQAVVTKRFQGLLAETDAPVHEDCPPWGQLGGAHGRQPCLWDSPPSPYPPACGGRAVSPFVPTHPSWGTCTLLGRPPPRGRKLTALCWR